MYCSKHLNESNVLRVTLTSHIPDISIRRASKQVGVSAHHVAEAETKTNKTTSIMKVLSFKKSPDEVEVITCRLC